MAIAATYLSDISFSTPGDLTAQFAVGTRVLAECGADGPRYGTVTGASALGGTTTVVLGMDPGQTLTANLAGVRHGNDVPASLCNHAAQHAAGGRDPLPSATDATPGVAELATEAEGVAGTDAARVAPVAVARQQFVSWLRDAAGEFAGLVPPIYNLFAPRLALPAGTVFARASSASRITAAGGLAAVAAATPAFDFDPAAGHVRGLRLEGAATRLNTVAAAPSATENVAVAAQAYTLSFYGPGSVTLSGAHAATVTGAGPFPARTAYTFTPSAGTLALTPSGPVQHLQLEAGSFPTSVILGEGAATVRAVDMLTAPLSGMDFNPAEGTLYVAGRTAAGAPAGASTQAVAQIDDGANANRILVDRNSARQMRCICMAAGVATAAIVLPVVENDTDFRLTFSWKANAFAAALDAGAEITDASGPIPSGLTAMRLGASLNGNLPWHGTIKHLALFPRALSAAARRAIAL